MLGKSIISCKFTCSCPLNLLNVPVFGGNADVRVIWISCFRLMHILHYWPEFVVNSFTTKIVLQNVISCLTKGKRASRDPEWMHDGGSIPAHIFNLLNNSTKLIMGCNGTEWVREGRDREEGVCVLIYWAWSFLSPTSVCCSWLMSDLLR